MYAKILQRLLKNFHVTMGRAPETPKEWAKLRTLARELSSESSHGIPSITSKTTPQDLLTGPHISQGGPKGDRIWDLSQKKGEVIDFPSNPNRTLEQQARSLGLMNPKLNKFMQKGDVTVGTAPKTKKSTLDAKKDRHILMRDADEDILRIKRENKEAVDRFRRKMNPDEPDKFQYGGIAPLVGEPSYSADFYDDRTPMEEGGPTAEQFQKDYMRKKYYEMLRDWDEYQRNYEREEKQRSGIEEVAQGGRIGMAGGGALFKFIERLFIKASNDIRLGRGKWKGLDQKQRMVQHDNLTKKVTEFQKTWKTA